ncbi:MAG: hypothetical protein IJ735_00925 [Clostridia bacterium]|nr:hypothetical protein [Clostridia bacterium]
MAFFNPSQKAKYHAEKLKSGKNPRTGKPLSDFERGQSVGYLKARQDSADAYNAKHNPEKLKANKQRRKQRYDAYKVFKK